MAQKDKSKTIVPPNSPERWGGVDPKAPPHFDEPKDPVLLEYVHGGRTAIITFNRPQAGNTVTTALGVRLCEITEEIEAKVSVRCAILTGAGQDFCRGADLRERKAMDSEQWLKQRKAFDRTLHTLRNMRRPIFAAVNGRAVGGGSEFPKAATSSSQPRTRPSVSPRRWSESALEADRRGSSRANSLPDRRCIN